MRKKILEYQPDGSLATTTADNSRMHDFVLEIQLYRRIYRLDQTGADAEYLVDWEKYGVPFMVGYGSTVGESVQVNDNDFPIVYRGAWHWTITNEGQESGLPAYGYYKVDGEFIPVRYRYIPFEIGAYSDTNRTPYSDSYGWLVGLQPSAWDGDGSQYPTFDPIEVGQDQDRLVNIQATDLEVDKEWSETPENVEEVYVKIWRQENGNGKPVEDYTADIAKRTDTLSNYGFVDDPSRLITLDNGVLVLGLTRETGGVLIHNVQLTPLSNGSNLNTNRYNYWVEEVGYKDSDGNVYLNTSHAGETSTFFSEYDRSDENGHWRNEWTSNPTDNKLQLLTLGKNKFRIKNRPTTDIDVAKKWIDENGVELEGPWNKPDTETPVTTAISFKVKRSDGQYLTFNNNETLTIAADGQRAVVRCSTMDGTAYSVRYVSDADDLADIGNWKTRIHGLQRYASDGTEYTYTIEELRNQDGKVLNSDNEPIASCKSTTETTADGTYVIINEKVVTSLSIEKIFAGDVELTDAQKQKISFEVTSFAGFHKVFVYGHNGEKKEDGSFEHEDQYIWKNGTLLIKDIDPGSYTVEETGDDVYNIFGPGQTYVHTRTYRVGAEEFEELAVAQVKEGELTEVEITNTYDEKPVEYDLIILKVDKEDNEILLPGAVFVLTQLDESKAPINGVPAYKKDEETGEEITVDPTPAATGTDGKMTFAALKEGYYEIKETVVPKGYVLSSDPAFYIHVKENGVVLVKKGTGKPDTWSEVTTDGNVLKLEAKDEQYQATVGNEPGKSLPKTGGPGTGIFGTFGGILILAGAYLLTKRKKQ